ncbi:MAG: hypothetical protein NT056_07210 [Proteobacteria bacterium]|nr:hypothetical protein [Pseudomonadota bacterium]
MVKILGFYYVGAAFNGRPKKGAHGLPELTLASAREGLPYEKKHCKGFTET